MSLPKSRIVVTAAISAAIVFVLLSYYYNLQLNADRSILHNLQDRVVRLKSANAQLREMGQLADSKKALSDAELMELLRLRSEVGRLRKENAEYKRDKAAATEADAQKSVAMQSGNSEQRIPKGAWAFKGYASPADAFQSLMWAMKSGNTAAFFESLTPEAQEALGQALNGKSNDDVAKLIEGEVSGLSTLRLDRIKNVSDDAASFVLFSATSDDGTTATRDEAVLTFKNVSGQWKASGIP